MHDAHLLIPWFPSRPCSFPTIGHVLLAFGLLPEIINHTFPGIALHPQLRNHSKHCDASSHHPSDCVCALTSCLFIVCFLFAVHCRIVVPINLPVCALFLPCSSCPVSPLPKSTIPLLFPVAPIPMCSVLIVIASLILRAMSFFCILLPSMRPHILPCDKYCSPLRLHLTPSHSLLTLCRSVWLIITARLGCLIAAQHIDDCPHLLVHHHLSFDLRLESYFFNW